MWMWSVYLDWLDENRTDYLYLANLTAEIRRSWIDDKHRQKVKMQDFIFKRGEKKKEMTVEEQTSRAKTFFAGLIALAKHRKKKNGKS